MIELRIADTEEEKVLPGLGTLVLTVRWGTSIAFRFRGEPEGAANALLTLRGGEIFIDDLQCAHFNKPGRQPGLATFMMNTAFSYLQERLPESTPVRGRLSTAQDLGPDNHRRRVGFWERFNMIPENRYAEGTLIHGTLGQLTKADPGPNSQFPVEIRFPEELSISENPSS